MFNNLWAIYQSCAPPSTPKTLWVLSNPARDLTLFTAPKKIPRICDARDGLWRRKRDSNPRYAINVYALSRGAPSATRPFLRKLFAWKMGRLRNNYAALFQRRHNITSGKKSKAVIARISACRRFFCTFFHLNSLVNLLAVHSYFLWSINAQSNLISSNAEDGYSNFITNNESLTNSSC